MLKINVEAAEDVTHTTLIKYSGDNGFVELCKLEHGHPSLPDSYEVALSMKEEDLVLSAADNLTEAAALYELLVKAVTS